MFVDIDNTANICVGDILYLKECPSTRSDYWWYAVRAERIEDATHVTVAVPNESVIQRIHYDDWNKSPDFEDGDIHKESCMNIKRLATLVDDVEPSSELSEFLDLL